MAEVERLTKAVGGGSAALAAAQEALAAMARRYEHSQKTTVQFMKDLNKANDEKKTLKEEVEGLKTALEAAKQAAVEQAPVNYREAQEALLAQFKVAGEATTAQLKTGVVKASCAGLCILSIGRGVLVAHRLPDGAIAAVGKPLNEQQRGGVER